MPEIAKNEGNFKGNRPIHRRRRLLLPLVIISVVLILGVIITMGIIGYDQTNKEKLTETVEKPKELPNINNNVGEYIELEKTMLIKNIETQETITEIKLDSPLVNHVIRGKDRLVAEFSFNNVYENFNDVFNKLELYDLKRDMTETSKEVWYKYQVSDGFKTMDTWGEACEDVYNEINQTDEKICTHKMIGTHEEEQFKWIRFDETSKVPLGEIRIGIFTDVNPGESIDWIPTLYGVKINEWAIWTESLNVDLWAYYTFNASAGALLNNSVGNATRNGTLENMGDTDWTTGIIGNALNFDGRTKYVNLSGADPFGGYAGDLTIAWWILRNNTAAGGDWGYRYPAGGGSHVPLSSYHDATQNCLGLSDDGLAWDSWVTNCAPPADVQVWSHYVFRREGTNWSVYKNGTIYDSEIDDVTIWGTSGWSFTIGATQTYYSNSSIDEMGIWNRSLSQAEITQIYNDKVGLTYVSSGVAAALDITLVSPENDTLIETDYIDFNISMEPTIANLTNVTLNIWMANGTLFNSTTNLLSGSLLNSTMFNITNFSLGNVYSWGAFGCMINSTDDQVCIWSSYNKTFTSSAFSTTSTKYNTTTFETSREIFVQNISANPSVSSASAVLWYNGSQYSSTATDGTSGVYSARNSLDIPLQATGGNKSFFWEWTFGLTGGSVVKQNSTTYSHQVNTTIIAFCNATFDVPFINFTTKEAENPFPKLNATFKVAWKIWLGEGDVKKVVSWENVSEVFSNFTFCMFPDINKSFQVDSQIEFDATGYAQNNYYLNNATLTNVTQAIDLFLLNDSLATVTELQVVDGAQNPLSGIYIQIQLYDVGTDTFYTTAMAKTSSLGKDIVYLNWYSTFYKFILTKDGEVLETTDPFKIAETPQIFTIQDTITFGYDKFRDFVYSLTYNDATENFVLTFTKPSGLVEQGCLRVTKRNSTADTEICLTCETSASATLYCNIGEHGNGTYIATFYATGSWWEIDWIYETIGGSFAETIYNLLGNEDATAYAFLFSGIVVSMFFLSPILAIFGLILGMLGGAALGFTVLNYSEFIGIVIVGGLIVWIIKR